MDFKISQPQNLTLAQLAQPQLTPLHLKSKSVFTPVSQEIASLYQKASHRTGKALLVEKKSRPSCTRDLQTIKLIYEKSQNSNPLSSQYNTHVALKNRDAAKMYSNLFSQMDPQSRQNIQKSPGNAFQNGKIVLEQQVLNSEYNKLQHQSSKSHDHKQFPFLLIDKNQAFHKTNLHNVVKEGNIFTGQVRQNIKLNQHIDQGLNGPESEKKRPFLSKQQEFDYQRNINQSNRYLGRIMNQSHQHQSDQKQKSTQEERAKLPSQISHRNLYQSKPSFEYQQFPPKVPLFTQERLYLEQFRPESSCFSSIIIPTPILKETYSHQTPQCSKFSLHPDKTPGKDMQTTHQTSNNEDLKLLSGQSSKDKPQQSKDSSSSDLDSARVQKQKVKKVQIQPKPTSSQEFGGLKRSGYQSKKSSGSYYQSQHLIRKQTFVNNQGKNEMQRKNRIRAQSKLIHELFERDHSDKSSDFQSQKFSEESCSDVSDSKIQPKGAGTEKRKAAIFQDTPFTQQFLENVIFESVLSNDVIRLKDIISAFSSQFEKSKKLNIRDQEKRTPLFYAIYHNNYELINLLLLQGADTLFSDKYDRTILHYCGICNVNKSIIQLILDYNDLLDSKNNHTEEALKELEKRKGNQFDLPKNNRPTRMQLLPGIGFNLDDRRSSKVPQTSVLGPKEKTLDIKKIKSSSDDVFGDNAPDKDSVQGSANPGQFDPLRSLMVQIQKKVSVQKKTKEDLILEEVSRKKDIEKKIKTTKGYLNGCKKFINLSDQYGRTALHYAVIKESMPNIRQILKNKAFMLIRDRNQKKAVELTENNEIQSLLRKEETFFEERYMKGHTNLRKSAILDNFGSEQKGRASMKRGPMTSTSNVNLLFDKIDEKSMETSQSSIMKAENINQKLQLDRRELASMSDKQLSLFSIGLYKDNSLTHKMRFEDRDNFVYLLRRGISVCNQDKYGNNGVHMGVKLEKLHYISFMLEGTFDSPLAQLVDIYYKDDSQMILKAATRIHSLVQQKKHPWVVQALQALEWSNEKEGNTVLHMAVDLGNIDIFKYLIRLFKVREHLKEIDDSLYGGLFKPFQAILDFKNNMDNTALIYASKRNQFDIFEYLVAQGANMYENCSKMMNVLHYAVLNENEKMVELIVFSDAEKNKLMKEKNFKDETPVMMDDRNHFQKIFSHIWGQAAAIRSNVQSLEVMVKKFKYNYNQKTPVGQNTPLHFAVINENVRAVDYICRQKGLKLCEKNRFDQTPADLASLIPKKKVSIKIINIIQRALQKAEPGNATNLMENLKQPGQLLTPNQNMKQHWLGIMHKNCQSSNALKVQSTLITKQKYSATHFKSFVVSNQQKLKKPQESISPNKQKTDIKDVLAYQTQPDSSVSSDTSKDEDVDSFQPDKQTPLIQKEMLDEKESLHETINTFKAAGHEEQQKFQAEPFDKDAINNLLVTYDFFIDQSEYIGTFSKDIFLRFKQKLQQETKNRQYFQ